MYTVDGTCERVTAYLLTHARICGRLLLILAVMLADAEVVAHKRLCIYYIRLK